MPSLPVQTTLTALDLARSARFAEIRDLFAPQLRELVVPDALKAGWEAKLGRHGPITSVGAALSEPTGAGPVVVKIPIACERGAFTLVASVSEDGLLGGLQLAPPSAAEPLAPWEAPSYAEPGTFGEQDVTLGQGALAVPGTLSVPHGAGPWPGVVLLAGSGSLDRDETIGRNKPLTDVAWGLATRGIAVIRFDKVTYAHAAEIRDAEGFTLDDEYLPHARAALALLRQLPAVGAERLVVLGHSLGGAVAPRIAAAEPDVAGLIILAGGAEPLHWVIVRQARYLASLSAATEAQSQAVIEALSEKARAVDSPNLTASTPASRLPLGAPASYWLDLRSYDPAQLASTLHKPMLILQGGRDYQCTVEDDLARWRASLDGRPGITIRVYPDHNHLFTPGHGPSSPAEYEPAQHVDGEVIDEIATWVTHL